MAEQTLAPPGRRLAALRRRSLAQLARRTAPRLFSTSAFLLCARLVGAAAGFAFQLLLARNLSPDELGIYFTATSLVVIGGILAAHGYPSIATRFVSRYRLPSAAIYLRAFVRHAQSAALALGLTLAGLVALSGALWPGLAGETRAAIMLSAITIPFVAGFRLYGSLATATRSFWLAYLPDVCLKPVVVLAGVAALLVAGADVSIVPVMLIVAVATVGLSLAQFLLLRRSFPVALGVPARSVRRSAAAESIASKWRREAHAVLPVAVLSQFFADLSILLATPVLDSADMGAFGICVKLAFLVGFFVALTQNMATPDIADALNRHEGGRGGLNHAASCIAASAATGLALLVCMTWGDQVLRLFGAEYVAAQQALVLLVGAQLVRAIFGPTSAVLTLVGERRVNLMLAVAALVVLAAGTAGLGTLFGIDGAAAAVLLATIFWSGASAYMLHRAKGVRVDLFSAFGKPA